MIGLVEDAKYASLKEAPRAVAYLPLSQSEEADSGLNFEIRASREMPAMVLGEVSRVLAIGILIGEAGAMASSRYVASFLFGVKPNDVITLVFSAALLATVALLAGAVPAWRAARLDPMLALRED